MINLTPEQISQLKAQHKKERDKRICDRIKAVLAIADGYTYAQVAEILLVDDETVRRHIKDYLNSQKLTNNHKGSEGKLNNTQSLELIDYLQVNTYLDVKPIIKHVQQKYKVKFSKSGMQTWLNRNGFSYKKPHTVPAKANTTKQKEFIKEITQVMQSSEPLYFIDASHPAHQSKRAYGWIYKGSNKALPTTAYQKRIHLFGALEFHSKDITVVEAKTINSQAVIALIEAIKTKHNPMQKIHFALDNAKYQKSYIIQEYLANNPNIIFHYLPAYSPNLNLIERLWKFMHKKVSNNQYYQHFTDFKDSIMGFFNSIDKYKKELENLFTFKFQTLDYNIGNFVK